ncbi:MAG: DUF1648 domain-containing protein [Bacteroidetes bacterium]|nr:DUF1648 domain-containing protein [Bacteroidota bacterium]
MNQRPRIKIKPQPFDTIIELLAWVTFLLLWLLTILYYNSLPDKIPTHFNASGYADGYGSKSTFFILPVIGTLIFALLTILNKYPHIFNYSVNITEENAYRQYSNGTRLVRYIKFSVECTFLLIVWSIVQSARGKSDGLGVWQLPIILSMNLLPTIYFAVKSYRLK